MVFPDRDKHVNGQGPGPVLMGAASLLGEKVVNMQEHNLGDIKEIMLVMRSGRVAYAVLVFGGFFGMGEKLFAVPWEALKLDTTNNRFVLAADKERLKAAPGFDAHAWPDMSDVAWARQIHTFYGTDPSSKGGMETFVPVDGMVAGVERGAGASKGTPMGGAPTESGPGARGSEREEF